MPFIHATFANDATLRLMRRVHLVNFSNLFRMPQYSMPSLLSLPSALLVQSGRVKLSTWMMSGESIRMPDFLSPDPNGTKEPLLSFPFLLTKSQLPSQDITNSFIIFYLIVFLYVS